MEPSLSHCQRMLKRALSADEGDMRKEALQLYTQFVEMTLKADPEDRRKLQPFAVQAMDRAEEIKKFLSSGSVPVQTVDTKEVPDISPATHASSLKLNQGAALSYTPEELRVLEHGSRINNLVVVPFMSIDLKERFLYPMPFTDHDGLLQLSPKQTAELVSWLRLSEIVEDPKMVAGSNIDPLSIRQTVVSDCSFVASLIVAALYETRFGKALISSIMYPKNTAGKPIYNPSGKYSVKLHVNGVPRKVVIDEMLPTGRHQTLLCSHSKNKNEFWVSILEKAYLKIMGGYDFPGSNSNIDLHALTGWIPERISTSAEEDGADAIFERLRNGQSMGRCVVTVATGELSEADEQRTGLVGTHAYAVLDLRVVNGVKLLQLKNPWSHLRWKGNYSEKDLANWTDELQRELKYDPLQAEQVDNGIFWIDYRSVLNFFDVFYINWDPSLFQHTYCVHRMWNAGVGPCKAAYTISQNPQFVLKFGPGNGSVWVLLSRHITSISDFRNNREYISIVAYENGGRKVYYPYEPKPFHEGVRINSPHYLCKIRQNPHRSRQITLAVSQYEKTTTIYFTLRAYSRDRFELQEIDSGFVGKDEISGQWKGITAGGCANYEMTHRNNPKIKLTIGVLPKHRPTVAIELRGPKIYQVGFELTQLSGLERFNKMSSGSYRSGYCALEIEQIPPGTYLIVPTTFLPNQEGPFILTVRSQNSSKLEDVTTNFEFQP